jgi:hypothetical protein
MTIGRIRNGKTMQNKEEEINTKWNKWGCRNKPFCPSSLPGHDLVSRV